MKNDFSSDSVLTRILQGLVSAVGLYALVRFLPRLVKSATKRFVIGVVGEILLVALTLLVTNRSAPGPKAPSAPNASSSA